MKRIFASFTFLLCTAYILQAQTKWFVTPGAPITGTGTTWVDPLDLQTAITTASPGDSVFVAQGIYQRASGQYFSMKEGVKIYGGFAGTETSLTQRNLMGGHTTTLQGNNARVIWNNDNGLSSAAILDGFTVTNGYASYGAGITNSKVSPTISNCIFLANNGGGVYNGTSSTTVVKCIFLENTGTVGSKSGGVVNASSNNASVINCIFWKNTGYLAGGVYVDDLGPVSPRIINCIFYGNTSTAPFGNGIGGIYAGSRAVPTIQNCIIWGNTNGIRLASSTIVPVVTNNIIQDGHLGNLRTDPLFINPANPAGADNIFGTADDGLNVQAGSPAFNGGTANTTGMDLPNTDIAGATRIQGNKIDIGAYESGFTCSGLTTLHVDSSIAVSGDGSNWTTAFKTLDEALMAANQCTTAGSILVAKGTYRPLATKMFNMLGNVKIYGGFPGGGGSFAQRNTVTNTTILKSSGTTVLYSYRVDTTALLDGFTFTGGAADSLSVNSNFQSSPAINNCVFSGNVAAANGGSGGAMSNREAAPVISNCIFLNNSASFTGLGGGGAIWNTSSSPEIRNCIFFNNRAAYGGAMYNYMTSSPIMKNTVFVGNVSTRDGGALANYGNSLKLSNVTFVNNVAGEGGGAIDNYNSSLTVTNTIFWGNTAGNDHDIWLEYGPLSMSHSLTQGSWTGTGNLQGSSSPFVNAATPAGADGTWSTKDDGLALKAGSPCLNAGAPDTTGLGLGDTDITGNPRIVNAAIDMGAYEFDNTSLPVTLISFTGNLHNSVANLQWNTSMETNFHHFGVEKSTDGALFHLLGEVRAKGGPARYTYSTLQQEPTAYYRLRMVDNDGSAKHSAIIRLSQSAGNSISVYPNPATNYIKIEGVNAGSIVIYAADGKLVKTVALQAGLNRVDVSDLSAGMYYGLMNDVQVKFIKK